MSSRPIVWSIAGSDSGGGAGIQADIKTIHGLGCHPCTAITAVTAQNTVGVQRIHRLSPDDLRAQLESLAADLPPAAVKIGMVPDKEIATVIRKVIDDLDCPVVLDPVLVSTSGSSLSSDPGGEPVWLMAPRADIVCPNLHEVSALLGRPVRTADEIESAAQLLLQRGCRAVMIKGGHAEGALSVDYVCDGMRRLWLANTRIDTADTHGTGCTQSSAIAAAMALGHDLFDALVIARMVVNEAIRNALSVGTGPGPVCQGDWPETAEDLPWSTDCFDAAYSRPLFPPPGDEPIGLYPCVESAQWVERLANLGVTTLQLRNKTLRGEALTREIRAAIGVAREHGVRLFINDYWSLAIELGAYGVHLGQEDLDEADINAIEAAGLRLGISTHCHAEVARAHALRPSYIACGPIWETKIKVMPFAPQGVSALHRWRRILRDYPLVAIGGIDAMRIDQVVAAGANGISLIRAITEAADYRVATAELLSKVSRAAGGPGLNL